MNTRDLPEIPAAPPTAAVRAAEYAARQAKGVDATKSHKTHRAWIMAKALQIKSEIKPKDQHNDR